MNPLRTALPVFLMLHGVLAFADDTPSPEEVVRDYAATWNANDPAGFFALQASDIHKFALDAQTSEFKLTTSGLDVVKQKYTPLFARASRVHVEIVSLTTLGDIVVTRDHVTNDAEKYVSNEMTMYQVRDGRIINIWYLGRAVGVQAA